MSSDFYHNLKGFSQFSQLTEPDHYVSAPADWYVVITDVKGSTQAITEGRYKEVNLVGAAAIIAILNMAGKTLIPYAFGGDGATLLVPPHLIQETQKALSAVQARVQALFAMELRAGCIPISALYDRGAWLKVAKFNLSPTISQAAFQGTALGLAEKWLKKGGGTVIHCTADSKSSPNLEGLECRWQPIENRNGMMLTLLVHVTPAYESDAWAIYSDILNQLAQIYPESEAFPVTPDRMHISLTPAVLAREAKMRAGETLSSYIRYLLQMYIVNVIGLYSFRFKKKVGTFDGQQYLSELSTNTDAKKFDEMLRMVMDSTPQQKEQLEKVLEAYRKRGEIVYGIHTSSQALMTCLVFNLSGNHIHFVDGADGGYAMAAKQMKQQVADQQSGTV